MECNVCGGREFNVEIGKQMCAECGTEIEKYVEIDVNDGILVDSDLRHRLIKVSELASDDAAKKDKSHMTAREVYSNWTTYEAYTLILQDWSQALVKLGASTSLPMLVLRMWAAYLNKIEVAFLEMKVKKNKVVPKTPKVGLLRNKRDLAHLHHQQLPSCLNSLSCISKQKKGRRKVERIMRKANKRSLLGSSGVGYSRAKSSAHNLSQILLATEQERGGTYSGTSDDCLSENSEGSKNESGESNNSVILKNKPVLRSRAVLLWLNHNSHIYDTLDLDSGGNNNSQLNVEAHSKHSSPFEDDSVSSVEEISRNVSAHLLAKQIDNVNSSSSQPLSSSNGKVNIQNTDASKRVKYSQTNDNGIGRCMETSPSDMDSQEQTKVAEEHNVTAISKNASKRYDLNKELDALFKNVKFNKPKKCDRRRRERMVSKHDLYHYKRFEPFMPTLPKLLALVYMACRINGEEILLLDLLSWCGANHIPYVSAPYLLQDSLISLSRFDLYLLHQCRKVPSHQEVHHHVGRLAVLLDAQQLPLPRLEVVTSRLLHILCLPESMEKGVVSLAKPCMQAHALEPARLPIHSVETIVAAAIVLLIKIQWGLNGVLENTLSRQVDHVNTELRKRGASRTLFCWRSWHIHMNRVLWFNETVEPGSPPHPWQEAPLRAARDASSLAHSFWSDGFWRRSKTTTDRDGTLALLFHQLANSNGTSLPQLLNEDRLFTATYHHLTGVAQQYRHSWRNDCRADKQDMKEVADVICQTSFECDQDDFLLNIDSLRATLESCGSALQIRLKSENSMLLQWSQLKYMNNSHRNKGRRKKARAPTTQKNICSIVYEYDESLTSDSPPLLLTRSIATAKNYPICDEGKMDEEDSESDNENTRNPTSEIEFVNPMEIFWLIPSVKEVNLLPSSFRWLLKLVAYACQTKDDDLLPCVHLVEGYFMGRRH
ncbi:hypothetical protein FHG87_010224 [Trinorchestia longiramus]|nr:hypothetical protein FHG87_010224 [Trinorchestia longiramus]